jgi:transposase
MIFAENIGKHMSIDEVSQSKGELYTYVTNKDGKGRSGTLAASIQGTKTDDIVAVLKKIPLEKRLQVEEITLDMAKNMESAAKQAFPNAILVTDRFHVTKLVGDVQQHIRINLRWEERDKENELIEEAKKQKKHYKPDVLSNGDTRKQLLARCRYSLAKHKHQWSESQKERMCLLFELYPEIKTAYDHVITFRKIYEEKDRAVAKEKLLKWIEVSEKMKGTKFNTAANSIKNNLENILNFFVNRHTNASAESFNAKIKRFRANLRGVSDHEFFFYRIAKLFA